MQCHNMSCSVSKQQVEFGPNDLEHYYSQEVVMWHSSTTRIQQKYWSLWIKYRATFKKYRGTSPWVYLAPFGKDDWIYIQLSVSSCSVLHWLNIAFTLFESALVQEYFLCSKSCQKDNLWTWDPQGKSIKKSVSIVGYFAALLISLLFFMINTCWSLYKS